jgi:hypothetical protein
MIGEADATALDAKKFKKEHLCSLLEALLECKTLRPEWKMALFCEKSALGNYIEAIKEVKGKVLEVCSSIYELRLITQE